MAVYIEMLGVCDICLTQLCDMECKNLGRQVTGIVIFWLCFLEKDLQILKKGKR